jgi:hypothetical protein
MNNIYTAVYECKALKPMGMPGYHDVVLCIPGGSETTGVVVYSTLSRFVVGKEYLINISEM